MKSMDRQSASADAWLIPRVDFPPILAKSMTVACQDKKMLTCSGSTDERNTVRLRKPSGKM